MVATQASFTPFTGSIGPLTRVSPFTHRDNATYLRILAELVQFINGTLRDETNAELERIITEFNKVISDNQELFTTTLTNSQADFNSVKADWDDRFIKFMADVTAQIALLNDNAVGSLITDALSATSKALDIRYRTQIKTTAKGDGSDETATLVADANNAVALGLQLVLDGSKTYIVDGLVFPSGLKLITNGAKFRKNINLSLIHI